MNMTLTDHERAGWTKAAQALYGRGATDLGHLLSACAAKGVVPIEQYDRAAKAFRNWLVFDAPKA